MLATVVKIRSFKLAQAPRLLHWMGFDRDDEVYVMVTPNDGTDNGVSVESDHAVVLNSLPTMPTVEIASCNRCYRYIGAGEDDLICSVSLISSDADGDPIDYTYDWYLNGGASQQR